MQKGSCGAAGCGGRGWRQAGRALAGQQSIAAKGPHASLRRLTFSGSSLALRPGAGLVVGGNNCLNCLLLILRLSSVALPVALAFALAMAQRELSVDNRAQQPAAPCTASSCAAAVLQIFAALRLGLSKACG